MAEPFNVTILGCGSATPSLRHNPSSQIVRHKNKLFMIDCGEGAQLQMRRLGVGFSNLRHIFISHLHGDHVLGLPGLLSTMGLQEVGGQIHVYTFAEGIAWLKEYMRISHHHVSADIVFHPVERGRAIVYEDNDLTVETIPLHHGVPTVGYIMREKPKLRKIKGDMVEFHEVPYYKRPELKAGADFVKPDGTVVPNVMLTDDPDPSRSYAYCSDTSFAASVIGDVRGVGTLYHESTYADDKAARAKARGHSTARQAGTVAREAWVGKLIIGHYSKSYPDESVLLGQAREEFAGTIAANEGLTIDI